MARPVFGQPYRPDPAPLPVSGPILTRCQEPARTWAAHEAGSVPVESLMGGTVELSAGAPCYRCLANDGERCHFLRAR